MNLTREDWVEIYYALDSKKKRVNAGVYGEEKKRTWGIHLRKIMEKIGPDGENMIKADKESKPYLYLVVVHDDVEPVLSGPFDNEEDRDEAARARRNQTFFQGGLFPLDIFTAGPIKIEIDAYSGKFFDDDEAEFQEEKEDKNGN